MNDETKEILIDIINYYNAADALKCDKLQKLVNRASKALDRHAVACKHKASRTSADVDPFVITDNFPVYKLEDEW